MKKVKVYSGNDVAQGADLALKSRLYVSGWQLSYTLGAMRARPKTDDKIAILFDEQEPVAVAVHNYNSIQVFCRKKKRRQGNGTQVVNALLREGVKHPHYDQGIDGSMTFFKKTIK